MDFCKIDDRAITPRRAHADDAGLDIYALEDVVLRPGEIKTIATGIRIALPKGKSGLLWPKSGLASKGLTILGGCIDQGYRGELKVIAQNTSIYDMIEAFAIEMSDPGWVDRGQFAEDMKASTITIPYGKPLTQLLTVGLAIEPINEVDRATFEAEVTERGEGGFGSTSGDIPVP